MMRKAGVVLCACMLLGIGGCATGKKQGDLEAQGFKNQVSLLEAQLQAKDEEVNSLREQLARIQQGSEAAMGETGRKRVIPEVKEHPSIRQIQSALTNAGYDPGSVDGKMGRKTKDAIRAFQRANNLPVDGKVGKKTWQALKEYLYKKVK